MTGSVGTPGRSPARMLPGPPPSLRAVVVHAAPLAAFVLLLFAGVALAAANGVEVIQSTATMSQRLARLPDLQFGASTPTGIPVIRVDDSVRYQRISGFGAAMTDTSAWLLYRKLAPSARADAVRRLFGDVGSGGIHLGFMRVPMGASDFTRDGKPYSYDDRPPGQTDPTLKHFSVAHDDAYILPMLRQIRATNPSLALLANPWSPPAWMKTNHLLSNWGHRRGALAASAYEPLAKYFVKFLQAYGQRGVSIDAITPQNEPGQFSIYPGMDWTERGESRWIVKNLVPALNAAALHPRIYGWDHRWATRNRFTEALLHDRAVSAAIAGIAWHCYIGRVTEMQRMHDLAPNLDQIETECSPGIAPGPATEMTIATLRNWGSAVLLWNLALDESGGPVVSPNIGCPKCTAVVTVDRGRVKYLLDYYQLGQASAFIQPGAQRIKSGHFVQYRPVTFRRTVPSYATAGIDDVAVVNPDGSKALLAYNNASKPKRFAVSWKGGSFTHTLPAGATVTFVWDKPA
jgi:glucosylceramidase